MKKTMIILGCLSLGLAHAQQGRTHTQHTGSTKRVGINTEKPAASFEVSKVNSIPPTQVQGFLLPHLSQTERNAMQKEALTNGLMIFNTSKNCIDWWDGTNWQCLDGTQKDEHGDEYVKYRATFSYTATANFTKKNCHRGEKANTISYTPTIPITGKGVSNISQADAERIAEANAKEEFNRLGQAVADKEPCRPIFEQSCYASMSTGNYFAVQTISDSSYKVLVKLRAQVNPENLYEKIETLPSGEYTLLVGSIGPLRGTYLNRCEANDGNTWKSVQYDELYSCLSDVSEGQTINVTPINERSRSGEEGFNLYCKESFIK